MKSVWPSASARADQPRHDVDPAARRKRHDDSYGFGGKRIRRAHRQGEKKK